MQAIDRFGYFHAPAPRKRTKTPDEILRDRIATLEQIREGHEARIEHLEAVVAALCHATGVNVPEPPGL